MIKGTGVSAGIGCAQAVLWRAPMSSSNVPRQCTVPALEVDRFEAARRSLHSKTRALRKKAIHIVGDDDAAIFDAYNMILDDEEGLLEPLRMKIRLKHYSAEYAITVQFDELAQEFLQLEDDYMRQRVDDVIALRDQLLWELMGCEEEENKPLLHPSIVVAKMLNPADIATMDLNLVVGIICEAGGYSSHTAIIARNLGIPTVLAAKNITRIINGGDFVALDGENGNIWMNPSQEDLKELRVHSANLNQRTKDTLTFRGRPTLSADSHRVELTANIRQLDDIENALASDAESVSLYRTELLFSPHANLPEEEEQYAAYCKVLDKIGSKTLTVRTYDDGGNPSAYKKKPETNPALGYRGIRMSLGRPSMFRAQLRALLRATAHGAIRILFPMVSTMDELDDALSALEHIKNELRREAVPFNENTPVGVYVTVPSAALLANAFAQKVNFLTIGANDLIQFTLALDKNNRSLSSLYHLYHPAVLRLIQQTTEAAHKADIPCFFNGEPPGFKNVLPILVGMGLDGFTQNSSTILHSRQIISNCRYDEARQKAAEILLLNSSGEVMRQLAAPNI